MSAALELYCMHSINADGITRQMIERRLISSLDIAACVCGSNWQPPPCMQVMELFFTFE